MYKRGMTLVELLVTLALAGVIFLGIFHVSTLAGKQIHIYVERYNAYNQIGYALDDMALRLPIASEIYSTFSPSQTSLNPAQMHFRGTGDVYNVTPYEGDTDYRYRLQNGDSGPLVLETLARGTTNVIAAEVLIEEKFKPRIEFVRTLNPPMEPNFCTIVVSANCSKSSSIGLPTKVVKAEGIKFWFVDVVAPN
jgi:prepilin-type N-terminal cleavage/methylation domain-containing protein